MIKMMPREQLPGTIMAGRGGGPAAAYSRDPTVALSLLCEDCGEFYFLLPLLLLSFPLHAWG